MLTLQKQCNGIECTDYGGKFNSLHSVVHLCNNLLPLMYIVIFFFNLVSDLSSETRNISIDSDKGTVIFLKILNTYISPKMENSVKCLR